MYLYGTDLWWDLEAICVGVAQSIYNQSAQEASQTDSEDYSDDAAAEQQTASSAAKTDSSCFNTCMASFPSN